MSYPIKIRERAIEAVRNRYGKAEVNKKKRRLPLSEQKQEEFIAELLYYFDEYYSCEYGILRREKVKAIDKILLSLAVS